MQAYRFDRARRNFATGTLRAPPSEVSAFAWFRVDAPFAEQHFMCLGGAREGIHALGVRNDTIVATAGTHGHLVRADSDALAVPGEWFWACATWSAAELKLFISGKLEQVRRVPFLPAKRWHVGCMGGHTGASYFSGTLARWGWVPRLLSPEEIAEQANGGEPPEDTFPGALEVDEKSPLPVHDEAPVLPVVASGPVAGTRKHSRGMR